MMFHHHHHHHHHHQEQHQGKTIHAFAKMPIIPERHLFLQGANGPGDSGLVLSTDAKPRLKWTHELHEHFIEAVCQLGGAEKATPKTVMKVMGIPGLTLYHLKSHLQKYRLSKNLHGQPNSGTNKIGGIGVVAVTENRVADANGTQTSFIAESQTNSAVGNSRSLEISEALQMQIEVQRRLHEQLEVQRHLQLRIEAQGKYLQSVLEKAQETLGRQNLGAVGLEAAKVQLSELVSKVSTQCLPGAFPELQMLCPQSLQPPDCSFESCLTSCEGSRKDSEIHNGCLALRASNGGRDLDAKERGEGQGGPKWSELQREKGFLCSMEKESARSTRRFSEGSVGDLSMNIGMYLQEGETKEGRVRRRDDSLPKREDSTKHRGCEGYRSMAFYGTSSLDLNAGEEDENDGCSDNKQLDLNGLSWD